MEVLLYDDPESCRLIWEKHWPARGLFDLWPVRFCFQRAFSKPTLFLVLRQGQQDTGFLPLCWDEKTRAFIQFPGETWQDRTWIEQNRLIARNPAVLEMMLDAVPGNVHLRYLQWTGLMAFGLPFTEDETGYLFYPGMYNYSFENYMQSFSGKSRKKIESELKKSTLWKVSYRFNQRSDVDHLFAMNRQTFGESSYFSDPAFTLSFENLVLFLERSGMLRITTLMAKDRIVAVDIGAVFKNTYTLLAGATDPEFPGIAKIINLFHLEWACRSRIAAVDFLCGDFNWKKRFHLTPRPLYQFNRDTSISYQALQHKKVNCA